MKTIEQLCSLERLAFETGKTHEALQAEYDRRALLPEKKPDHGKRFLDYLQWLYRELTEVYDNPNRSASLPIVILPSFNKWAEDILGMPVNKYLNS